MKYSDEEFLFREDIREKKITGHSAANKVGGARSTRCSLPSDYMSRKEIASMSGECKVYNINRRMTWQEFKELPDDIKRLYIKNIREKYGVSDRMISKAMGVSKNPLAFEVRRLGIGKGEHCGSRTSKENLARFYRDFGIEAEQESESEHSEAVERAESEEQEKVRSILAAAKIVADAKETPAEKAVEVKVAPASTPTLAMPERCTFVFNGSCRDALASLEAIIGNGSGILTVTFSRDERTVC